MLMIQNKAAKAIIHTAVPFMIIPLAAVLSALFVKREYHLLVSLSSGALSLLLFAVGFDERKIGTRRLVLCAVMIALCFAGRFIPFLKPVVALVIISGVFLGAEAGFLVGAVAALLSNFYFGQGPWTVFQMLAWGLIGLFGGVLSRVLQKNKPLLIAYGIAAGVGYSFIMDIWTVLWYNKGFDISLYAAALVSAIPYTVSYAVSNALFLLLLFEPFCRKLGRVKKKYGI